MSLPLSAPTLFVRNIAFKTTTGFDEKILQWIDLTSLC